MRCLLALALALAACSSDPCAGANCVTLEDAGVDRPAANDVGFDTLFDVTRVDVGFDAPVTRVCTPGAQVACACVGGGAGAQVCNAAGSALGACMCPDAGTVMVDIPLAVDRPDTGPLPDGAVAFLPDGGCPTNYGNCDDDSTNGCEADFRVGVNHAIPGVPAPNNIYISACGSCGAANCGGGNTHRARCTNGSCTPLSCDTGYFDCDGNEANSCESRLQEQGHCGTCDTVCPAGQSCRPGGIYYTCQR